MPETQRSWRMCSTGQPHLSFSLGGRRGRCSLRTHFHQEAQDEGGAHFRYNRILEEQPTTTDISNSQMFQLNWRSGFLGERPDPHLSRVVWLQRPVPSTDSDRDLASRCHHLFRPESEPSSFLFGPVTQHLTPISAFCLTTLTPRKSASVALLEGSNSLCRFLAKRDARKWYRVSETPSLGLATLYPPDPGQEANIWLFILLGSVTSCHS